MSDGVIIRVPDFGIARGEDGLSAYEQAAAGGYTGTEAQFNAELSSFKTLHDDTETAATAAAESATSAWQSATSAAGSAESAASSASSSASSASGASESAGSAADSATSAASSAASAAASAASAGNSASTATQKASEASASATAASESETNAASSEDAAADSAAAAAASAAAIEEYEHDAEAWAIGKRGGQDVPSTDATYHNNSKYYADQAGISAGNAASSASAASASESNAAASASSAASSASSAATSAATATEKAGEASTSASEASTSATSAAGSATNAASSATAASASATAAGNAQTAAETAQGKAEDAQEAAEQAQSDAEAAAQSVSQSAAQISQNASDISDLKSALETATGYIQYPFNSGVVRNQDSPFTQTPYSNSYSTIVACLPGDTFKVTARGGGAPRAWGFFKSDGTATNSIAGNSVEITIPLEITAPAESAWLVVNSIYGVVPTLTSGETIPEVISQIETNTLNISNIQKTIDEELQDSQSFKTDDFAYGSVSVSNNTISYANQLWYARNKNDFFYDVKKDDIVGITDYTNYMYGVVLVDANNTISDSGYLTSDYKIPKDGKICFFFRETTVDITKTFDLSILTSLVFLKKSTSLAGRVKKLEEDVESLGEEAVTHLTVGTINIGHFSLGANYVPQGTPAMLPTYRKTLMDMKCDLIGVSENDPYYNSEGTQPVYETVYEMFKNYSTGMKETFNCNAFLSDYPITNFRTTTFTNRTSQVRYYYEADMTIDGKTVHLIVTQLEWNDNMTRRAEINELITVANEYDRVIIMGDLNPFNEVNGTVPSGEKIWGAWEDDFEIWENAGYKVANGGYLGTLNTVPSDTTDEHPIPCDNIITSSNIYIKYIDRIIMSYMTDHYPFMCELVIY